MRNLHQLFTSILMVSTLLLAGCSKDKSTPEPEPEPEIITYTATYTVSEISDDFFTLGEFMTLYADKDGKDQIMEMDKAQMPISVTVTELNEDSKLMFNFGFLYYSSDELTKESYTFKRNISLTIKGSNGSMHSSTIKSGSITMGKDKVKDYLSKMLAEKAFESTVKQFMSNK